MKKYYFLPAALIPAFLGSCKLAEGIFKAGFWSGFLLVIIIIVFVGVIVRRLRKK